MFGKGALIYVIGFSIIFSIYQLKLNQLTVRASDNFVSHYMGTIVHEEAMTATNIGISRVWETSTNNDTFTIVSPPCTSFVAISAIGSDTVLVRTKTRSRIFDDDYYSLHNTTLELRDSVLAYFAYQTPVSQFFWFTGTENGVYWITGDTVWGPVHSNHILHTNGSPVFYGKVTAKTGISPNPAAPGNNAHFYGGWEVGVDASVPTDMTHLIMAAVAGNGGAPVNTVSLYNQTLTLNFLSNGNVIRTVGTSPPDTVALADIAPTGAIHSVRDIHVYGVFNGQVTLHTTRNIWIDNDITYNTNPLTDPNCTSFLGLVADQNVVIADNQANNNNVVIHANILAATGSMTAQNYAGRPVAGTLTIVGSIAQASRGAIGTFGGGGGITHGFSKRYYFDPRCQTISPPNYPFVRLLRLVSWWE